MRPPLLLLLMGAVMTGCPAATSFRCDIDSDCNGGYVCRDSRCVLPCSSDDECEGGECINQVCQTFNVEDSGSTATVGSLSTSSATASSTHATSSQSSVGATSSSSPASSISGISASTSSTTGSASALTTSTSAAASGSSGGAASTSTLSTSSTGTTSASSFTSSSSNSISSSSSSSSSTSTGGIPDAGPSLDASIFPPIPDASTPDANTWDAGSLPSTRGGLTPVLWLLADAAQTLASGALLSWDDLSGNNNHAFAYLSEAPLLISNNFNGHNTVWFDGNNTRMFAPNVIQGRIGRTVIVVARAYVITERMSILELNDDNNGNTGASWAVTPEVAVRVWGQMIYQGAMENSRFWVVTTSVPDLADIRDIRAWLGQTQLAVGSDLFKNSAVNTGSGLTCIGNSEVQGPHAPDNNAHFNGELAEVLVYNRELTDIERQAVVSELLQYYGLSN